MHRILSSLLTMIVVLLALAPGGAAQTRSARVTGRVSDPTGALISGATATLWQKASGLERSAVTGETGSFRFENLAPGEYLLSVAATGFSAVAQELALSAGENRRLNITLAPGAIIEKVTVTATRTEALTTNTAVPVSVIGRTEIEQRNLATIGDLFRYLPGTSTVNEGPFRVRPRIRGLDSNRVLILVDGERLNNTRTSTFDSGIEIGLVDVDQIETVEVVRGSGSVLYGTDALAGTINIITHDAPLRGTAGFHFSGGLSGLFSSNETGRRGSAYLEGAGSRFTVRLAQTLDRFDTYHSGARPTSSGKDGRNEATEVVNSQHHGSNTQAVGRFFFNDDHWLKASYERRRAADIGVPGAVGVFTAFFPFSNRDKVSARYEGQRLMSTLARLSASLYYQDQDRNFSNTIRVPARPPSFPGSFQFSETITDVTTIGFDLQSNWVLGPTNRLTAGASYFRDRNRDTRFIERLSPDFSTSPPSLVRSEDRSRSVPNATFADLAFFAQDEFQVTRRWRLIGGVRVDRFDIESGRTPGFNLPPSLTPSQIEDLGLTDLETGLSLTNTAVSGDFGIVIKPIQAVSLTARVGRSFRESNLFERFFTDFGSAAGFVVGNPDLKPESGVNVDTGIKIHTGRFAGSFVYFNNTYTNFLTRRPAIDRTGAPITIVTGPGREPISVSQTVNLGRTRIQGIEAELETPLPVAGDFLILFGNIGYLRGDDLQRHVPLDFMTPLKTVAGLRWQSRDDRYWAAYGIRIVTTQERLSPEFLRANGGAESGFVTHDLRGGVNFRRERHTLGLTVGLENLTNRFYREQFVSAPARGRSATIGIKLRFF